MAGQSFFCKTFSILSNSRCLLTNRVSFISLQQPVLGLKVDTRERLKQLKVPEKPKKPSSPYVKFVTERRTTIVQENPNLKQTEVIKKCAEDWKAISNDLKEQYVKQFKSECEVYDKTILTFNANLTQEQRDAIKAAEDEKKADRKKRKIRKLNKELNKPKRPIGAYMSYLMEQSKIKNIGIKELMVSLKGEWANLSSNEKAKYQTKFVKEKEKYEAAMKEWETKMVQEGRDNLVRTKSLVEKAPSRITQLKKGGSQ